MANIQILLLTSVLLVLSTPRDQGQTFPQSVPSSIPIARGTQGVPCSILQGCKAHQDVLSPSLCQTTTKAPQRCSVVPALSFVSVACWLLAWVSFVAVTATLSIDKGQNHNPGGTAVSCANPNSVCSCFRNKTVLVYYQKKEKVYKNPKHPTPHTKTRQNVWK